jgi:hypothetical protein
MGDVRSKPGTGLKHVSIPSQDRMLKCLCLSDHGARSLDLESRWKDLTGFHASDRAAQWQLCEFGLKSYRPCKKSLLTCRLAWA